ncbi:MAG: 3-phosphoshikimate 1-carboxyvinyltransferase [Calditrichaeota bacterium]|nr:3-phosphoshikimate 1-carboxyvinyltransferase [Calditrichota bacterium]
MKKVIVPVRKLAGEIELPGDKSISHRALMLTSLADGESEIYNLSACQDVKSTAQCLRELGIKIEMANNRCVVQGKGLVGLNQPDKVLDAGNSGTTMRLLSGILAGQEFPSCITGDESLRRRPMRRIIEPLRAMGAVISGRNDNFAPLCIEKGALKGIEHKLKIASAQVKSSILLAGLFAEGETIVDEPALSRDHTERMLDFLGAEIVAKKRRVVVKSFPRLRAKKIIVPGDISSAAFFLAAAAIVPDSEIRLKNVGMNPSRTGILDVLKMMGKNVRIENFKITNNEEMADLIMTSHKLKGVEIGGALIPRVIDEIPIIAILATQAEGETVIRDAVELRVKETDRIRSVVENLKKMGAQVQELPDGLVIQGSQKLKGTKIDSFGDHRIAMSFAVAGLVAEGETEILGAECADISHPSFFVQLEKIYA